jgi:hypothetical protein
MVTVRRRSLRSGFVILIHRRMRHRRRRDSTIENQHERQHPAQREWKSFQAKLQKPHANSLPCINASCN